MPGIVGIVTAMPRSWAEPQLARMVASIRHEDFYVTGTWIDESLGVYVGWTALKGSFADAMPLQNERGDITLIFSGEEYSASEAIPQLNQRGHSLNGKYSSYLVHLSEEAPDFPASLNGMFHGLAIDRSRATATLFNDRYGMHRVYYHEAKDAFYFSAEAKAILAARPDLRKPSPQGLGEFVSCSCVLENRTIFKDIFVLPAASAWTLKNKSVDKKTTYFDPRQWEEQPPLDAESYYQDLRGSLSSALPKYFSGPERVGVALTGGMDTRAIMAWHTSAAGSLPCYTFGGMFRECQDVRLARQVADACRQTHQVIEVGDDFLSRFPHYAERSIYLSEGSVDVYRSSDLYVSEKARQIAPAKVVGTYGSEIVRHAVMFKPTPPANDLFRPEFLEDVRRAEQAYAAIRRVHPVTFAAFRQSPWYHHGILGLEQTQLTVRSPYLDNNFVKAVYRAPASGNANGNGNGSHNGDSDVRLRLIADGSAALRRIPSDRGIGGNSGPLTSAIAHNFLEFTFKAEYAYDYGMPQWVARVDHMFSPLRLERLFLGRHKFLHYRVWYRDRLANYVKEMLLDPRTLSRPYLQRSSLEKIVSGHLKGDRNYTTAIHKMLTMELLHRLFFDSQAS
jgi:asparagine synthase (glutamine-hydrolysing)